MQFKKRAIALAVALSCTQVWAAPGEKNARIITAEQLRNHLSFIASDALEGRDTPSRGLKTAAQYLASHLARWGVKPAGDDGTYFQKIALDKTLIDKNSSITANGQTFSFGTGFLASATELDISAPAVFADHGWYIPEKEINPYEGLDVAGKIIIVTGAFPEGINFRKIPGTRGKDWFTVSGYAKKFGAKAVIRVPSFRLLSRWQTSKERSLSKGSFAMQKFKKAGQTGPALITASAELLSAIFSGEGRGRANSIFRAGNGGDAVEPFALKEDNVISIKMSSQVETVYTQNVIGIIEGSDKKLKKEYVAIGAHYDHVGMKKNGSGDTIYNGADDDGSGTVAVLSIAEAFSRAKKTKRSLLFIWHTGEEKGLWGSKYFTEYPTVDRDMIITQLNLDMIGRGKPAGDTHPKNKELSGPDEIYVIGSKMMSTELGALSEKVNKDYLKMKLNYKYDDPNDPNRFFFRSDHFNYAQKGIPVIFYFDGVHVDYHQVSDHFDKIDYEKLQKVTRTIYMTAEKLASIPKRPTVDKELPGALKSR